MTSTKIVIEKEDGLHLTGRVLGIPGVPWVAFSAWGWSALTMTSAFKDGFEPAGANERVTTPWGPMYIWTAGAAQGFGYAFGVGAATSLLALQDRRFLRRLRALSMDDARRGLALITNPEALLPHAVD